MLVVLFKSAKVFHLLVSPRQTLRRHESLSARWYPTLPQLRLLIVDERPQKNLGSARAKNSAETVKKDERPPEIREEATAASGAKSVARAQPMSALPGCMLLSVLLQ